MRVVLRFVLLGIMGILGVFAGGMALGEDLPFFTLASTSSTQNSGLYDAILPQFTADTGIAVRVVALGTGQAIKIAQNGDADALLVHHRPSEDAFVAAGYGVQRFDVMYNDFVLIGPRATRDAFQDDFASLDHVFTHFHRNQQLFFISRGDDSGTHKKEREIWQRVRAEPSGAWYREIGAGMGAALNMVAAMNAGDGVAVYTLSDRGTWLAFGNKDGLAVVWENEPYLQNPYGLIAVNPARFAHVKAELVARFIDWIRSPRGQSAIGEFRVDGRQLFCPNANGLAITRERLAGGECPRDLR